MVLGRSYDPVSRSPRFRRQIVTNLVNEFEIKKTMKRVEHMPTFSIHFRFRVKLCDNLQDQTQPRAIRTREHIKLSFISDH